MPSVAHHRWLTNAPSPLLDATYITEACVWRFRPTLITGHFLIATYFSLSLLIMPIWDWLAEVFTSKAHLHLPYEQGMARTVYTLLRLANTCSGRSPSVILTLVLSHGGIESNLAISDVMPCRRHIITDDSL